MSLQTSNSETYRDDEIDLKKLFQAIGNGISNFGKWLIMLVVRFRRTTLRYKFLLITLIILGAILGFVYNKITKPYYKTSLLLTSNYFNDRLIDNSISKLNALCGEDNASGLAELLQIKPEVAENIRRFDYQPLVSEEDLVEIEVLKQKLSELKAKNDDIQRVINQISIENKDSYIISVEVYDNKIIDRLEEALVDYFRNNSYIKNRIRTTKDSQLQLIDKLEKDISQLDSLKHAFNLNLKANASRKGETSSNVYVGESGTIDPTRVYSEGVTLFQQLLTVRKNMELGSDFELIDGFTNFSKPDSPGLMKTSVISALLFLGIGYLIIMLIEINKYLNKVEKERFNY